MMQEDDDNLLRLRYHGCQSRLANPNLRTKAIHDILEYQIPVFFFTPDGLNSHVMHPEHFGDEQTTLVFDLLRNQRDLAWINWFFKSGRFVCPLAEARICSAATPTCKSGVSEVTDLPRSEGCHVRNSLTGAHWLLADEYET